MQANNYFWQTGSVVKETDDAITIQFLTNGENFSWKPGQYVNLRTMIGQEQVSRSYSLISALGESPAVTIKRVAGGKMSNHIIEHARGISNWELDGPHGAFYFDKNEIGDAPVVLIGGGSGVTALYAILKTALIQTTGPILLINCNRTIKDVIFSQALIDLEEQYHGRLQIHYFFSREEYNPTFDHRYANYEKLSRLVLKKTIKKFLVGQTVEAHYFLCGPNGLLEMAKQALASTGVPDKNIHTEYYLIDDTQTQEVALPQTTKEVLFHFKEQTSLLDVQPAQTILQAALEDQIPLRYSCRQGTCGQCAAYLLAGRVHMKQNYALTNEQLSEGLVLLCQSYPLDDAVELSMN